jgi:hypothetical protein
VKGTLTVIGDNVMGLSADATANAYALGTALPGSYIGGVVGNNTDIVDHCSADATVEGYQCIGGLAGANAGNVTGCNSTGAVTRTSEVGRLVGHNTGTGIVSSPDSTSWVTGMSDGGDPVGWNEGYVSYLHSTYGLICDVRGVIVAGEATTIPVTLKTDELGALGYDGVQIHVNVYPRAGDVTIKLDPWTFTNELYSAPFDLPADYNQTIYPLVYCSKPGEYTFTFGLVEALFGPVIGDMMESIAISAVAG